MNENCGLHTVFYESFWILSHQNIFYNVLFKLVWLLTSQLDVAIDGADEVDSDLTLIKGGG